MAFPNELRATSDALVRDLDALRTLEEEKRTLPLDDPRVLEIAEQIELIAARVLAGSSRQTALAKDAADLPTTGTSIDDLPRPLSAILDDWRAVERRAAEAVEGSAEAREIAILADRLREEYGEAFARARSSG